RKRREGANPPAGGRSDSEVSGVCLTRLGAVAMAKKTLSGAGDVTLSPPSGSLFPSPFQPFPVWNRPSGTAICPRYGVDGSRSIGGLLSLDANREEAMILQRRIGEPKAQTLQR